MAKKRDADKPNEPNPDEPGFEQALSEVESIIERIEGGELGLEEQIAAYERGAKLLGRCRTVLAQAEQRVRRIDEELEGGEGAEGDDDPGASAGH